MAKSKINKEKIKSQFDKNYPLYERLRKIIEEVLEEEIKSSNIDILDITSRSKDFESFWDKIKRKGYTKPFKENEDFSGARVIYYFLADLESLINLVSDNFKVLEIIDKKENLTEEAFGYRDTHLIITIKDEWLAGHRYRDLGSLKAEIQLRTILMHAWDDIEHKLSYKNKKAVPPQLRRKFSRLSALLEVADEDFDRIKNEGEQYQESIKEEITAKAPEIETIDLNVDSLQAFIDITFPNLPSIPEKTWSLLFILERAGITYRNLIDHRKVFEPIAEEVAEKWLNQIGDKKDRFMREEALKLMLCITSKEYWNQNKIYLSGQDLAPFRDIIISAQESLNS